ncbi:hypothetical protein NECAME_19171 [Necator americanus]|uniref:Endonuclease/exonuclease/phosphatase domain-containing protein n=1 Tax=Necator americanus TaxID=51031 RepID=W2SSI9_NECAM|nr:hypothetical protein NECAME_19171 [Necator americanus]ETN71781.1 hypothetical protein NECAME_19171 [Necator americanus]
MTIYTYNARTLASEAVIEDLMMQAKKIKYDVIGLSETRRRHPLNAVYKTGDHLFLGTCDSRDAGGVGVLVNTSLAKNIDSFDQLTPRIGRMRRCGPTPALTILRSNIKLRRRSRSFLYGLGEVLPKRSCLLQGHNWRFQRQRWPKKNAGGISHRGPRPAMERQGGEVLRLHHDD